MTAYSLTNTTFQTKLFPLGFFRISFVKICVFSVIMFLSFYIVQVNEMTESAYLIENYEARINELLNENQNLEINFMQVSSLGNIKSLVQNLNFEKQGRVQYIRILEEVVIK